jgi:selenide,water dikinase
MQASQDASPTPYRLTQYSHGSGCGCKIAPAALEAILQDAPPLGERFPALRVGYEHSDDASVIALDTGQLLVSSADFFTPIVDDAYLFGQVAAANALSDVYAMGAQPLMANALLGWPVDKLPGALARDVLRGARDSCTERNVPLAGGHSIDVPEPIFGLSVSGLCSEETLVRNDTARAGDLLYLTKPLGIGVLGTALKRGRLDADAYHRWTSLLRATNHVGMDIGRSGLASAMTDVTGFGLLGHLLEVCRGSGLRAILEDKAVPVIEGVGALIKAFVMPDNTMRNWKSYHQHIEGVEGMQFGLLADPQTNGGLLVSVPPQNQEAFEAQFARPYTELPDIRLRCIGRLEEKPSREDASELWIRVE